MAEHPSLPAGVTFTDDNEIEIDFKVVNREGILQLRASGLISAEKAVEWLSRQREAAAKPSSFGGKLLDTFRAAFDPTDPRGVRRIGIGPVQVPVKTGLFAAGISPLAVTTAAAVPTAATTVTAATAAREALRGVAGPIVQRPLRSLGVAALGTAGVLGAGAILREDEPGTAPPPVEGEPGFIGPSQATPEEIGAGARAAQEALDAAGGDPEGANTILEAQGSSTRIAKTREMRFIPGRGIVEVDVFTPFLSETVLDALGNPVQIETPGESFVPELNEARFNEQERIRQENLRSEQQGGFLRSLPALTEFFTLLADPKTANLLRIASARAQGQPTVPGLQLPAQLGAIFGLEGGEAFPSGVTGGVQGGAQGVITGQVSPLGGGGRELAAKRATTIGALPPAQREAAAGGAGGFLNIINTLLGASGGGIEGPPLSAQITPGSLQGFDPEVIGALQAGLIGSGTTLAEQQRQARRSALPGGTLVGAR